MPIQNQFGDAVLQAWTSQMDFGQLISKATELEAAGLTPLAAVLYQTWLNRNPSPYAHAGYFNLALSLSNSGDDPAAEAAYRKAIEIYPAFAQPRLNLGMLYERQGKLELAVTEWKWVADNVDAAVKDNTALVLMALNNLGRVLETRKQFSDASAYLLRSLNISANQPDVLHHLVHLRQKQCIWPLYTDLLSVTAEEMRDATSALAMLSVTDDPQVQLNAAKRFVAKKNHHPSTQLGQPQGLWTQAPAYRLCVFRLYAAPCVHAYGRAV